MLFELSMLRPLSKADEKAFFAQHDADIELMLPLLGPLFGLCVMLFSAWDFMIDPGHALNTLAVRALLVAVGAAAYLPAPLHLGAAQRCAWIYSANTSAVIVSSYLLEQGFLYGLAGITACVFTLALVTLRVRVFLLTQLGPTLLFLALSALSLPPLGFFNGLVFYLLAVGLAAVITLVIRAFRQKAYRSEKKLLHVSRHDSLTGACNRAYLSELAQREIALATRHGRALAVAMLDIDHFKSVNDTYGHNTGDEVIRLLVATCQAELREIDHFGRIGGEEFVCVLPETDLDAAHSCAERLRRAVEATRLDTPQGPVRFTVSIGVATLESGRADWSALLKDADNAMYCAKNQGRNRVALAPLAVAA